MATRLFELSLSVPCENVEGEEAVTEAVIASAKQLYALAAMLAFRADPRLTLKYTSTRKGRVVMSLRNDEPPLITGDTLEAMTSPSDAEQ